MSTQDLLEVGGSYTGLEDRFGYSKYSVVLMASLQQQGAISLVRSALGCSRSIIPAHVTVTGMFSEVRDLEETICAVRDVAACTSPFHIRFSGKPDYPGADAGHHKIAFQWIEGSPEFVALRQRVYDALAPLSINVAANELDDACLPYITVYEDPAPRLEYRAPDLLSTLHLGEGFNCDSLFLMGHKGGAQGGRWVVVREFAFGSG